MTALPEKNLPRKNAYNGGGKSLELRSTQAREDVSSRGSPVIIKKYANRRLYNTETSSYVTLEDLSEMVRSERDFLVYDAKTGEELTHAVLTQIIVDEEGKSGQNLLPIGFLRQLIRFYGHSIEQIVPKYLEFSLATLVREQERYHKQFPGAFGAVALEAMQEQAKQNLALFERAMTMFTPFAKTDALPADGGSRDKPLSSSAATSGEIAELKVQLEAMQSQLNRLTSSNGPVSSGNGDNENAA